MTGSIKGPTVTDAMVEAGVCEATDWLPRYADMATSDVPGLCRAIYIAMEATRTATNRASEGDAVQEHYGRLRGARDSLKMAIASAQGTRVTIHLTRAKQMVVALEDALTAKPAPEAVSRRELVALLRSARPHVEAVSLGDGTAAEMVVAEATLNAIDALLAPEQAGGAP